MIRKEMLLLIAGVSKLGLLLFLTTSALGAYPDAELTPGTLCHESDPDFHEYRYPAVVAHCDRNVSLSTKKKVAKVSTTKKCAC